MTKEERLDHLKTENEQLRELLRRWLGYADPPSGLKNTLIAWRRKRRDNGYRPHRAAQREGEMKKRKRIFTDDELDELIGPVCHIADLKPQDHWPEDLRALVGFARKVKEGFGFSVVTMSTTDAP